MKEELSHVWKETDEEVISIKVRLMVWAHKHAVAWFMTRCTFGLFRDPTPILQFVPLCLTLASEGIKCRFDLQYRNMNS